MSEPTEIRKNQAEVIRIEAKAFNGRDVIDARVFYESEPGVWSRTKKGLCLQPQTWREVVDAVTALLPSSTEENLSEQP